MKQRKIQTQQNQTPPKPQPNFFTHNYTAKVNDRAQNPSVVAPAIKRSFYLNLRRISPESSRT